MKAKYEYEQATREAHSWYMAERTRSIMETATKYGVKKHTLIWRFRQLNLETKRMNTHHYNDLTGVRFGRCVVLEKLPRDRKGGVRWKCICDCGVEFIAYSQNLKSGSTQGCGCGRTGEKNKGWNKAGRSNYKGYEFIRLPEHPRANMGGWVREHIVVMETMLGRNLLPGEEVHHINGIRNDNRPENLELWNKSHPAGARVQDLIEYSLSILRTYKPDCLTETANTA